MEAMDTLEREIEVKATTPSPQTERLLEMLEVKVDAFAICEIENRCALRCSPLETAVIHFVLKGQGTIEWAGGAHRIGPGIVVIVPRHLAKQINGLGPVSTIVDAEDACPLADGLMKFSAVDVHADLVLGCGSLDVSFGSAPSLFDSLNAPLFERIDDELLPRLLEAMLVELSAVRTGTRAIVSTIMKQMIVLLLRSHVGNPSAGTQFWLALADARLVRALMAMMQNPEAPHTLTTLARIAGMSRTRFTESFSAAYGQSPMQFLQATRLLRAARMLQTSPLPTKAVAVAVGYASRSHFSRAFRDRFGIDPSHFRTSTGLADVE